MPLIPEIVPEILYTERDNQRILLCRATSFICVQPGQWFRVPCLERPCAGLTLCCGHPDILKFSPGAHLNFALGSETMYGSCSSDFSLYLCQHPFLLGYIIYFSDLPRISLIMTMAFPFVFQESSISLRT